MARPRLAARLAGMPDLPMARCVLAERLASAGPVAFALEIEPLFERAAGGAQVERDAIVVVASWVAHACAAGDAERVLEIGLAAVAMDLPLTQATFETNRAQAALARRGRLAEVGIPIYARLPGTPPRYEGQSEAEWRQICAWMNAPGVRAWMMRSRRERARMHHDPIFVGRLLDERWIATRDVVMIAARRPSVPAIVLAVATRDRWFCRTPVREAIAENPFTPGLLARVLALPGLARTRSLALDWQPRL